ncbi:WD40-repeat-containing domain protein [Pilobolus umbonatus]|nr:WD40-repeat-containing domain protein [Pilobolus umbonatus]
MFMDEWSDDQKAEFAYQLLLCIPTSKTINLMDRLAPLLYRDFITLLSYEIALHIIRYLDIKSLARISRVSRRWKQVSEDQSLWRDLFVESGWHYNKQSMNEYLFPLQHPLSVDKSISSVPIIRSMANHPESSSTNASTTRKTTRLKPFKSTDLFFNAILASNEGVLKPRHVYSSRSQPLLSSREISIPTLTKVSNRPHPRHKYDENSTYHYSHTTDERYINWKRLFRNRTLIEKRWQDGKCKMKQFPPTHDFPISLENTHNGGIYCLQFNHSILVTGSRDKLIKIWDIQAGTLLYTLAGHHGSVLCLQFNDRYLISGSSDTQLIIWDIHTGEQIRALAAHEESVLNLKFDSSTIVSCSKDRSVRIWDLETGTLRMTLMGHRAAVNAVQFKDKRIVSASGDRTIKIWDMDTGVCLKTLDSHSRGIACVEYDGHYIISGSSDQTIRVWDAKTGQCIHSLTSHTDLVRTLQLDSQSKKIVSGSYDSSLKIWNLESGTLLRSLSPAILGRILNLQFDFGRIVCCSNLGKIVMYDFTHGIDTQFLL